MQSRFLIWWSRIFRNFVASSWTIIFVINIDLKCVIKFIFPFLYSRFSINFNGFKSYIWSLVHWVKFWLIIFIIITIFDICRMFNCLLIWVHFKLSVILSFITDIASSAYWSYIWLTNSKWSLWIWQVPISSSIFYFC